MCFRLGFSWANDEKAAAVGMVQECPRYANVVKQKEVSSASLYCMSASKTLFLPKRRLLFLRSHKHLALDAALGHVDKIQEPCAQRASENVKG